MHWAVNDTPAEVTNLPTKLLWGDEAIEEELLGLRFRVRPNAFLQTNTAMAERLYATAREFAALTGRRRSTTSTAARARSVSRSPRNALTVWGVEISEEAVACAIENAALNGIVNAAFFAGNVGQSLEELHERAGQPDVVVVDPPRAGLVGKAVRRTGASGRRGSSTSRATRRRCLGREGARATSSATRSSAAGRWTCSRTRRTSSRSACSSVAELCHSRQRCHSRSAFGTRKPSDTAGSAGRPGDVER